MFVEKENGGKKEAKNEQTEKRICRKREREKKEVKNSKWNKEEGSCATLTERG